MLSATISSPSGPFSFASSGTGPAPIISVTANGQPITDGETATSVVNGTDFGQAVLGSYNDYITYTIRNTGNAVLDLGWPLITPNIGFAAVEEPNNTVAAGGSTTMVVELEPVSLGPLNATLSFTENDPATSSPFTFAITATGIAPTLSVTGNGQPITDYSNAPSTANGTDFGKVAQNTGGLIETYSITNTGPTTLVLGNVSLFAPFSVVSQPAGTLAPGASTSLGIRYLPTGKGVDYANVTFSQSDPESGTPFEFEISGTGVSPTISVSSDVSMIYDGLPGSSAYGTSFGPTSPGVPLQNTYTIKNTGTANLLLGTVTISDTSGSTDFSVISQPASVVSPGGSTTLTVQFLPTSLIFQSATVMIPDNDPTYSTFEFGIAGQAVAPSISVIAGSYYDGQQYINDGSTVPNEADETILGATPLNGSEISQTFAIYNESYNSALVIGNVVITGPNAADFSVTSQPATSVIGEGDTFFTIQFHPSALGVRAAQVSFTENDPTQPSPFTFAISAVGEQVPTSVTLATSASSVSPIQRFTLTATVSSLMQGIASPSEGTVTFYDGQAMLGTAPVTAGQAVLTNLVLPALGNHILSATYSDGQNLYAPGSTVGGPNSTITTIAGSNNYIGDGGPATSAELENGGVIDSAVDASGNVYIVDAGHNAIRKIDHATGVITTVAGNGAVGSSGNGGQATGAELNDPVAVALDAAGNLFISDRGNNEVRRVAAATGIISVVAGTGQPGDTGDGGPATSAELGAPAGLGFDLSGNLLIACGYGEVRALNLVTNIITTIFSGQGEDLGGLAVDAAGDIFIADAEYGLVRKLASGTDAVSIVAGGGSSTSVGDGGLATSASLDYPEGLAIDAHGNLLIADSQNYRLRSVNLTTGIITTVVGNGTAGFTGDGGPAASAELSYPSGITVDSNGNWLIVDGGNLRVREVSAATGNISTYAGDGIAIYGDGGSATSAGLFSPTWTTTDAAGDVFFVDQDNTVIREIHAGTGVITTVAGNGVAGNTGDGGPASSAELESPLNIAADATGDLYIVSGSSIREINAATGIISTVLNDGNYAPEAVVLDKTGNLFFTEFAGPNNGPDVRKMNLSTSAITIVAGNGSIQDSGDGGLATLAGVSWATSLAVDANDNLYIDETYNGLIRRVDGTTGIITTFAGDGTQTDLLTPTNGALATTVHLWPNQIAVDGAGDLLIANGFPSQIIQVNPATDSLAVLAGNLAGSTGFAGDGGPAGDAEFDFASGVAVDPDGDVIIADDGNNRIREVESGGVDVLVSAAAAVVTAKGQAINDGANTTTTANGTGFGSAVRGTSVTEAYTVTNTGNAALTLGNVTIGGPNAADFQVVSQPAASVSPGGSTTFVLQYRPSTLGPETASVSFTDNDPTQASPFTFAISGVGVVPVVTTTAGTDSYELDSSATAVDSGVTITDTNASPSLSAAVSISGGFQNGDTLNFASQNGITGSYNSTSGVLTLTGGGTGTSAVANYQAALQSITFSSTSSVTGTRTVSFTVTDGSAASAAATKQISVVPFEVMSLSPNTTGFVIGLNAAPNLKVLNLYSGGAGSLGTPDLTVLDGSTPVQGSLVWNAANDTATWIQTRGALAAGTYNVTLVSGSSAWVDANGNLLGAGSNYTTSFTVAAPTTPILTLPDFARGPGQPVNVNNAVTGYGNANATSLPVAISSPAGVTSVSFELDYSANYLNISGVTLASGVSGTLSVTNTTPGVLLVGIANFTSMAAGGVVGGTNILNISATVPSAAISSYGASLLLNLVNAQVDGAATPGSDSLEKVVYFGDTNADGKLTAADASLVARNSAHLDSGFTAYPLTDPRIIADVTGSTNITAASASLIAQAAVHITQVDIPTIPTHTAITLSGVDPTVAIAKNIAATAGQTVNVPVSIADNALGVASADFAFKYNPAVLSLAPSNITLSKALSSLGWTVVSHVDNTNGVAYVSIFGTTALPAGTPQLLSLTFTVAANAPSGVAPITIDPSSSDINNLAGSGMILSIVNGSVAVASPQGAFAGGLGLAPSQNPATPNQNAARQSTFAALADFMAEEVLLAIESAHSAVKKPSRT